MPIIKSAIKRMKQTAKRRERNVGTKKAVKAAVRAFTEKPSQDTLSSAQSAIDTAVKKNVLQKGTAARRKSQLAKTAKAAGVKAGSKKKAPASKPSTPATPKKTTTTKKTTVAKKPAAKKPAAKKAAK